MNHVDCPYCDRQPESLQKLEFHPEFPDAFAVRCQCGAYGPPAESEDAAFANWNRRPETGREKALAAKLRVANAPGLEARQGAAKFAESVAEFLSVVPLNDILGNVYAPRDITDYLEGLILADQQKRSGQ